VDAREGASLTNGASGTQLPEKLTPEKAEQYGLSLTKDPIDALCIHLGVGVPAWDAPERKLVAEFLKEYSEANEAELANDRTRADTERVRAETQDLRSASKLRWAMFSFLVFVTLVVMGFGIALSLRAFVNSSLNTLQVIILPAVTLLGTALSSWGAALMAPFRQGGGKTNS